MVRTFSSSTASTAAARSTATSSGKTTCKRRTPMAGGKANTYDNDLLKLLFNATPIPNIADNAATSPLTNLYLSLHTADPGAGGNQNTSEATYTSYARVAVARTTGGFTVSSNSCVLANPATFPTPTGGAGE